LIDSHGRTIRDLRLSVTDRCNFRCTYCMDPDVRFVPNSELLTVEELLRVTRVCVGMGVRKVRLTGGEPTLHPELVRIIEGVAGVGVDDVALTTNGSLATPEVAARWRRAGLDRITVSLDTLKPERMRAITRSNTAPARVLESVEACLDAGLGPVKINAVVVRGYNDDEVEDLAELARIYGVDMRFIEFMPLDSARAWDSGRLVRADEIIARVRARWSMTPLDRAENSETSLNFAFADGAPGRVGVIASVTRPFCGACSRLRITADGMVRPCLFSRDEWDLRALLRSGADDARLRSFLAEATWGKQAGHGISEPGFQQPDRPMSAIGG